MFAAIFGAPLARLFFVGALLFVTASLFAACGAEQRFERSYVEQAPAERPNFVVIQTDDLDYRLVEENMAQYPEIARIREQANFSRSYVTNPNCCPSRSTFLSGDYSHNHGVLDNTVVGAPGGEDPFLDNEPDALPVWLDRAGYRTAYAGRYLNNHDRTRTPPGWDVWKGRYAGVEGLEGFGKDALDDEGRHHDDALAEEAEAFIAEAGVPQAPPEASEPFYLQVATLSPHRAYPRLEATFAQRHAGKFADLELPRGGSYNEPDVSDKPRWVREMPRLTVEQREKQEAFYRDRARAMLGVDDLVGTIRLALVEAGVAENTYLIFTSDNGYHLGEHRLFEGKTTAYEEDIRVPLYVSGPGVVPGARDQLVANNDLAPTIADLAKLGAREEGSVDGRSLAPLLESPDSDSSAGVAWERQGLLIEAPSLSGMGRPAYRALRTKDALYVQYDAGGREFYTADDPYQLENASASLTADEKAELTERLNRLAGCAGDTCREAEGG